VHTGEPIDTATHLLEPPVGAPLLVSSRQVWKDAFDAARIQNPEVDESQLHTRVFTIANHRPSIGQNQQPAVLVVQLLTAGRLSSRDPDSGLNITCV